MEEVDIHSDSDVYYPGTLGPGTARILGLPVPRDLKLDNYSTRRSLEPTPSSHFNAYHGKRGHLL